jgi:hypothetical protein
MVFSITITNSIYFAVGLFLGFIISVVFNLIFKKKPTNKKTSLPTIKGYIQNAHKDLFSANNNLIKLFEVFNEIENERP